ncbi:alfa-L-rhamnosidase [Diaporthe helianthi]|uniref:Alfa-L-rhamnosidase n=1 Tax=Diaporthe helianthi TaxID=158607 RepID=A0A2P5I3N3_DIAHE|nr:alfa-L-rhamnosidase [Diaporthe helianthi]
MARLLGNPDIAITNVNQAAKLTKTFRAEYVTKTGRLACVRQAGRVRAHIALQAIRRAAHPHCEVGAGLDGWMVSWEAFKVTTGFAGTPATLQVLVDIP